MQPLWPSRGHQQRTAGQRVTRSVRPAVVLFLFRSLEHAPSAGHGAEGRRQGGVGRPRQRKGQDAPPERRPLRVHAEDDGVPAGERVPARAPPHHTGALLRVHVVAAGRRAAAVAAAEADGGQEHDRGRGLHGLLRARHGARHPGRRQDRGHRHQPGLLRHGPASHQEGRRGPQGGLPRGPGRADPGRAPGRRGPRGQLRLRLRGRRQAQLRQVPRAAAEAGKGGRRARLRQHALGRHRGAPGRREGVHGARRSDPGRHEGVQRHDRRRRPRGARAAPRRRRHHYLPPRRLMMIMSRAWLSYARPLGWIGAGRMLNLSVSEME